MTKAEEKKIEEIKYYGIEEKFTYWGLEYRFYSRYNEARGAWKAARALAVFEGEIHHKLILQLINKK